MAESNRMTQRNGLIELMRFVFAMVVVMSHTSGLRPEDSTNFPFAGGYIAVEFFLILSGYYACRKIASAKTDSTDSNVYKQYLKMLPPVVVSVVIYYIVYVVIGKLQISELPYALYEMLLLQQSGIYKTFLDLPLWYLSAYFICLIPFTALLKYRFFNEAGTMIAPLLIYGYLCRTRTTISVWSFTSESMFLGLLRAFAGLCMDALCYKLSRRLIEYPLKEGARKALFTASIAAFIVVLACAFHLYHTHADYLLVLIMTLALAVIQSRNITLPAGLNKTFCTLGKLSIYIYCSHWQIRFLVPYFMPNGTYYEMLPVFLVGVLLYAVIVWMLSDLLRGLAKNIKRRMCNDTEI